MIQDQPAPWSAKSLTSTRLNGNVQEDVTDLVPPAVPSVGHQSRPSKLHHHAYNGNPDIISTSNMPPGGFINSFNIKKKKKKNWGYYCLRAKNQLHKNDTQ